jgi:orotate phosphoribosyltransferase
LIKAAQALRSEGGVVHDVFVLLDRENGGKQRLAGYDVNLYSVISINKVALKLYEMNSINKEQLNIILEQRIF